jgi:hypothetical protein
MDSETLVLMLSVVFAAGSESLEWPGGDAALLGLLALWSLFAWTAIRLLRPSARVAAEGA